MPPSLSYLMIRATVEKGAFAKALHDYKTIVLSRGTSLDHQTIAYVLETCKNALDLMTASTMHARFVKSGFGSYPSVLSSLVTVYLSCDCLDVAYKVFDEIPDWGFNLVSANLILASLLKNGEIHNASKVFRRMPGKDVVSWNTMIMGCVRNARPKEAISFFDRMLDSNFEPDGFTFSSVLTACGRTGALRHGERVHHLMAEKEIKLNSILSSALIDMYSKCGSIASAKKVFDSVPRDNVSVWNAMITGFAIHGLVSNVLETFSQMENEAVSPDAITFVGILTACSHCGMVEQGRKFFVLMRTKYSIEPELEHYGAMVDLLGRAGHLDEAYSTISSMPMNPDLVMWRALLSASRTHRMTDYAKLAIEKMSHLESGDYVLLSNTYTSTKRWDHAERVRELMKKKKIRKKSGMSWAELGGGIHQFRAGDRSHPDSKAIYMVLEGLMRRIKMEGYVPTMDLALVDVTEEEKEGNLSCHSEKLATAFVILKTSPGTEIRVSKNLRTCYDCHCWMKMVSKVLNRVIIMRDRIRFHRFEGGSCSCNDYW
ncbi:hypothetical protein Scep_010516 [Stephania cephalantha]|uniref:DYW domain-containing protein n=1 Tax=Stephania cephalantha TaxID=152367 RepID=A0AAP0JXF5_9MAGN